MNKLFISFILILFFSMPVQAYNIESIQNNMQVIYSPSANIWSTGGMAEDRIVFTKTASEGTGGYSNYSFATCEIQLNSNYEFLYDFRLIGVDNENLRFYEVIYKDCKIEQKLLMPEDIQKIFPDAEIIKLSEFNKGVYNVISNNTDKKILLYNDLNLNLHKYFISPKKNAVDENIKALIQLPKKGKVKFAHIADLKEPVFVIKVR